MDYKKEIMALLDKINDDKILLYILTFITCKFLAEH